MKPYKFIISGGGTGGHIYPAIAIANELKQRFPDAGPVDRFFNKMTIGPISARMNWSLQVGSDLFTPHRAQRQAAAGAPDNHQLCLRLESQTLRKLPQTGFVLFTIRTHIEPVSRWKHTPNAIDDLAKMLNDMSVESQSYKGASLYAGALAKPT